MAIQYSISILLISVNLARRETERNGALKTNVVGFRTFSLNNVLAASPLYVLNWIKDAKKVEDSTWVLHHSTAIRYKYLLDPPKRWMQNTAEKVIWLNAHVKINRWLNVRTKKIVINTKFIWVRPYRSPTFFNAFAMNNPTLRRHRRFPRQKPKVQWICRSKDYAACKSGIWNLKWKMEHLFAASLFITVAAWPKTSRSYSISFTSEIKQINLFSFHLQLHRTVPFTSP